MGIPLLAGRDVSEADSASAPTVAVVDERAARLYWPGQDPIGKTIPRIGAIQNVSIVGVARSVEKRTRTASPGTVHVALQQFYQAFPWQPRVQVAVRAAARTGGGEAALAGAVRRLHPDVPLFDVRTKEDALRALLSLLGVLAVILSAAGVYGIVAYAADARTREFGIRAALGAEPAELALQVCGHGARLAAVGIVLGVLGAAGLGRAISALLFGVAPFDALTYLVSGSLMLLVTLAASAGPAVRAMSPDLLALLRSE
jgi:putative ABC transport system permease protein